MLLHEHREPDRRNAATRTAGRPVAATRAAASRTDSWTRCGPTLTLATRSPGATTCPSNTVNTSSGSSRLSRSTSGHPDLDDARDRGVEVEPRLGRPTLLEAGGGRVAAGDRPGEPAPGVVLVDLAPLRDEHGELGAGRRVAERGEIVPGQTAALGPPTARDRQVAGEDRAGQRVGRARARDDAREPHPP